MLSANLECLLDPSSRDEDREWIEAVTTQLRTWCDTQQRVCWERPEGDRIAGLRRRGRRQTTEVMPELEQEG